MMMLLKRRSGRRGFIADVLGFAAVVLALGTSRYNVHAAALPFDVQNRILSRLTNGYCPGYMVAQVTTNGSAFFGFGQTTWDSGVAPTEDSIFEIGSITKTFTCTMLSEQVMAGNMALSDPVAQYLPDSVVVPSRHGKSITLQHLATHSSGLPRMPDNFQPANWLNPYVDYTVAELYPFLSNYTLPRDPGAEWEYSNLGVGLLGHVLTLAEGVDYASMVRRRVTQVLGMADTAIALSAEQRSRLLPGFNGVVPVENWDFDVLEGAGALRSTTRDMAAYVSANLGLIPSSLYRSMTNAHRLHFSSATASMGLGWLITAKDGDEVIWHGGNTAGYSGFIGFRPSQKTGVIVLANSYIEKTDVIGLHLLNSSLALDSDPPQPDVPLATLRSYVGHYERDSNDFFDIGLRHNHLTGAYSGDGGIAFTLYATSSRAFSYPLVQATGTFQTNTAGSVTSMVWRQNGAATTYRRANAPARLTSDLVGRELNLRITGDSQATYVIEATSDWVHWTPVSTNTIWAPPAPVPIDSTLRGVFFRLRSL